MDSPKGLLKEFLKIEGVVVACLVSIDGFLIDSVGMMQEFSLDDLTVAAAIGFGMGKKLGENIKGGELKQVMLEYEGKTVLISKLPGIDVILFLVSEEKTILGAMRYTMKKLAPKIAEIM